MGTNDPIGAVNRDRPFNAILRGKTFPVVEAEDVPEALCLPTAHTPIFSRITFNALSVSRASASMTFSSSTISAMGR